MNDDSVIYCSSPDKGPVKLQFQFYVSRLFFCFFCPIIENNNAHIHMQSHTVNKRSDLLELVRKDHNESNLSVRN